MFLILFCLIPTRNLEPSVFRGSKFSSSSQPDLRPSERACLCRFSACQRSTASCAKERTICGRALDPRAPPTQNVKTTSAENLQGGNVRFFLLIEGSSEGQGLGSTSIALPLTFQSWLTSMTSRPKELQDFLQRTMSPLELTLWGEVENSGKCKY